MNRIVCTLFGHEWERREEQTPQPERRIVHVHSEWRCSRCAAPHQVASGSYDYEFFVPGSTDPAPDWATSSGNPGDRFA